MPLALRIVDRIQDQQDFSGIPTNGLFLVYNATLGKFVQPTSLVHNTTDGSLSLASSLFITAGSTTTVPLTAKAAASQSADLLQLQNSSSGILTRVAPTGAVYTNISATAPTGFAEGFSSDSVFISKVGFRNTTQNVTLAVATYFGYASTYQGAVGILSSPTLLFTVNDTQGNPAFVMDTGTSNTFSTHNLLSIRNAGTDVTTVGPNGNITTTLQVGTAVGLTIKATSSQTGAYISLLNNASQQVAFFDAAGRLSAPAVNALSNSVGQVPLLARGFTGQTGDLTQWQDINTVLLRKISADGSVTGYGNQMTLNNLAVPSGLAAGTPTSGGTFAANTYFWVITATNPSGETTKSSEVTATVTLNQQVPLTWSQVTGATGYKIYRSTTSGTYTSPAIVTTITNGTTTSYTDTGTATTSGSPPPTPTGSKLVLQAWNNQSGNMLELRDSTGALQTYFNQFGGIFVAQTTNAGAVIQGGIKTTVTNVTVADLYYSQNYPIFYAEAASQPGFVIQGASSQTADLFRLQNSSSTKLTYFNSSGNLYLGGSALGGASSTDNWLNITGTFPTTLTAGVVGSFESYTTAGSSAQDINGHSVNLVAGYTGANRTIALGGNNAVAGTGASLALSSGSTTPIANIGFSFTSTGSGAGWNVAGFGEAANGASNYGLIGKAISGNATNVAVSGFTRSGSGTQVAGFFQIGVQTPTFSSAALIADNGATSSPIFLGRVNGTTQVTIDASGNLQVPTQGIGISPQANALLAVQNGGGGAVTSGNNYIATFTNNQTPTSASSAAIYSVNGTTQWIGTADSSVFGFLHSAAFQATINLGTGGKLNQARAIDGGVVNVGVGTVNETRVGAFATSNQGGGTITTSYDVYAAVTSSTSSSIGTSYGVYVDTPSINTGGTITNRHGLYVNNQSGAGTINNAITTGTGLVQFGDAVTITGSTAASVQLTVKGAASQSANAVAVTDSSNATYFYIGPPTISGTSTTANWLSLTRTFNSTPTAGQIGIRYALTTAGSASQFQMGQLTQIGAGYVGSSFTVATEGDNIAASTGNALGLSSIGTEPTGNTGVVGFARGTTTGLNVGNFGEASNGGLNIGKLGKATSAVNSATNIGVAGFALNTGTSPVHVAGYFGLQNSTPTFASAALIADNGGTTSPVFLGRVNGTTQFQIDQNGAVSTQPSLASSVALTVKGASSQTGDLLQVQNSSSQNLVRVTSSGQFMLLPKSDIVPLECFGNSTQTSALALFMDVNGNQLSMIQSDGSFKGQGCNISLIALLVPTGVTAGTPTAGGSFAANTYFWVVTATNANGETTKSSEVTQTVTLNQQVLISWTQVAGATGYKIYRSTTSGTYTSPALVTTITNGTTTSYTDTGSATTSGAPPTTTTGSKLVVQAWNGQTANMQEWQSSAGAALTAITNNGSLALGNGGGGGPTAGGSILMKDAGGTVRSIMYLDSGSNLQLKNNAAGDVYFGCVNANTVHIQTNAADQITVDSAGNVAILNGNLNLSGAIGKYNNIATNGLGVPAIYASGRLTGQTATVASVTSYTPAADGSFMILANVRVSAYTSGTINLQVTYQDETNVAQTLTMNVMTPGGVIQTGINAANPFVAIPVQIRAKGANAITVLTSGTFTATYNVEATIAQIRT